MKLFPVAALTFSALAAGTLAATAPTEFADLKWGATIEDAAETMKEKGAVPSPKHTRGDTLVFSGGTFAGMNVASWDLTFEQKRFCSGRVKLKQEGGVEEQFRKVKQLLTAKYGTPAAKQVGTARKPKFVPGRGYVQRAAKKPPLSAKWTLESPLDRQTITINCWVKQKQVHVQYANESLKKLEDNPEDEADDL